MGFTYWARGLGPPGTCSEEGGRLSPLQSVVHDLSSLVVGGVASAGAELGPLDILATLPFAQLQVPLLI
jgi:hypothetical protein